MSQLELFVSAEAIIKSQWQIPLVQTTFLHILHEYANTFCFREGTFLCFFCCQVGLPYSVLKEHHNRQWKVVENRPEARWTWWGGFQHGSKQSKTKCYFCVCHL